MKVLLIAMTIAFAVTVTAPAFMPSNVEAAKACKARPKNKNPYGHC